MVETIETISRKIELYRESVGKLTNNILAVEEQIENLKNQRMQNVGVIQYLSNELKILQDKEKKDKEIIEKIKK